MESHTRQLNKVRRRAIFFGFLAAKAFILLTLDWCYIILTNDSNQFIPQNENTELIALEVFEYEINSGIPHVTFSKNVEIPLLDFTFTNPDGTITSSKSIYILTNAYETPFWASINSSKYAWIRLNGFATEQIKPDELPPHFIELVKELIKKEDEQYAAATLRKIDESTRFKLSLLGLAHNIFAFLTLMTAICSAVGFVVLFNKSRG